MTLSLAARTSLAHTLLAIAVVQLLVSVVPWPAFALWILRFVAREALWLAALCALGALALWPPSLAVRGLALVAFALAVAPTLAAVPLYRRARAPFSIAQYLTGRTGPRVSVRRDLPLFADRPDLLVDVYPAVGPGPHPFVVVVHGGSWLHGDKGEVPHVSHALAQAGVVVFDVRYRLAPAHLFPAAVSDVKCVFAQVTATPRAFDIDPSRGMLVGRSAGAQIALVAAYTMDDPAMPSACESPAFRPRSVVSVYAPTDLAYGYDHPIRPDVVHGPESLGLYLGGTPRTAPEAYRIATPQTYATHPLPFTLLVHGTGDAFVRAEHALRLADVLAAHHQPHELYLVPFAEHGFDVRAGGVGEQLVRALIVDRARQ